MSTPDLLVPLCHHRWSLPALAALDAAGGATRFAELGTQLRAARGPLRAAIDELVALGFARRNTGVGHPLRPEYFLTPLGRRAAPAAAGVVKQLQRMDLDPLGFRKWTIPISAALDAGPMRFSELRSALDPVTPRALTLALRDLDAEALVARAVEATWPPTTRYRLDVRGRRLARTLRPLAEALAA